MAEFALECPNHDLVWAWRNVQPRRRAELWRRMLKHRGIGTRPPEPRIVRVDGMFMRPRIDYTEANALGSRGVVYRWTLPDGVYLVTEPDARGRVTSYSIVVDGRNVRRC